MTKTFQSHGRREDEPWEKALFSSLGRLLRHFILPQQEVRCANSPLSDWTLNHVNTHPMCLHHTMQMSNPRLDNHTPSPSPSLKIQAIWIQSSTLFLNVEHTSLADQASFSNVKKIQFQTVSCPVKSDRVSWEEWGRVSSYMSWLASSLWPQKLPCNLDSKWSPGWRSAKTNKRTFWCIHARLPLCSVFFFSFLLSRFV